MGVAVDKAARLRIVYSGPPYTNRPNKKQEIERNRSRRMEKTVRSVALADGVRDLDFEIGESLIALTRRVFVQVYEEGRRGD